MLWTGFLDVGRWGYCSHTHNTDVLSCLIRLPPRLSLVLGKYMDHQTACLLIRIFMLWLISAVPCDSRSSSTTCCFFVCAADIACGSRTCYSSPAHQLFSVCFQSSSFSDLSPACTPAPHYSSAPVQIRPKPSCCSGHVSCLYYCGPFRFLSDGKFVFHSLVIDEGAKYKTDV